MGPFCFGSSPQLLAYFGVPGLFELLIGGVLILAVVAVVVIYGAYSKFPTEGSQSQNANANDRTVAMAAQWFYQAGASNIFPDLWEAFLAPIPVAERADLLHAYYRRLTGEDEQVKLQAAKAWSVWEASTSKLLISQALTDRFKEDAFSLAFARIEAHYFVNHAFLKPNQLLNDIDKIRHIPGVIVQGRYDVVCPATSAWDLHQAWPEADFHIIPDAGHSMSEAGILDQLIEATDRFGG